MRKFFLLFQLIFIIGLTGCNKENNEDLLPDIPKDETVEEEKPTLKDEIETIDLNNKIFLNVLSSNKMIIPLKIYDINIEWDYDNEYLEKTDNQLKPIKNGKTKLIANIDGQALQFHIEINNLSYTKTVQYGLNFHYMFISDSKKMSGKLNAKQIVLHNTANSAPAINEIKWLANKDNTSSTSFHYAVDDTGVYQAIPTNIIAHHAGVKAINYQAIGVEIAKSMIKDNTVKDEAIKKGAQLISLLMSYYQIEISDVITHYEASGKHCPHDIFDRFNIDKFYDML